MYNGGQQIGSDNRTESRPNAAPGRQQSCLRHGKQAGHHRGLRAGHVGTRVIRELGRASRLLGSTSRKEGDRHNQHPGLCQAMRLAEEPALAQAGRNTKSASHQGTGREHKAHRPGRTKAVVATHSTVEPGRTSARRRGEPRPKGPTITLRGAREGNAGHDVCAKERQEGL
jgi:hypothetical protein